MTHLILCMLLLSTPSHAADDPEVRRLATSIDKLAQKNAWDGVERAYTSIVELGGTEDRDAVLLAAEAARNRGDVANRLARLQTAQQLANDAETKGLIDGVGAEFGQVALSCKGPCPTLLPEVEPFRPDLKNAIAFANTSIDSATRFEGYVPVGDYVFGYRKFTVRAGDDVLAVESTTKAAKLKGLFDEIALQPQVELDGKFKLMLNGAGVWEDNGELVFVAALYTKGPTAQAEHAITANEPKRIAITFLKPFKAGELGDFFTEKFEKIDPDEAAWADEQNLLILLGDVAAGDRVTLDWTHKRKTVVVDFPRSDPDKVGDETFMNVLWSVFLSEHSPSVEMTRGMLGVQ